MAMVEETTMVRLIQAWEKSCEDALALQGAIYTQALNYQNNRFADRQTLNSELFR